MCIVKLKLSGALEEFTITSRFLGSKMQKNQLFEENKRFECSFFFQIQVQVIATCLVDLKKHQTHAILLMTDFLRISKN